MHHLTKQELSAVLSTAHQTEPLHWLMFLVAYSHGLRATEVCGGWITDPKHKGQKIWYPGLTGNSVQNGYLVVQRLKNSNKTIQPLLERADPLLNEREALELLAQKRGTGRLFPYTRQWFWALFKQYGKAAGIPAHRCHPHVMKHSIAMHVIKQAGIENVRQYLGHKSGASTLEYLKVNDDEASQAVAAAAGI